MTKIFKITSIFKYVIICFGFLALAACDTTSSIPYKASTRNIITIQETFDDSSKVTIASVAYPSGYKPDLLCRLLGDVDVGNGQSIPEYIQSAFEEELFDAGRLDYNSKIQIQMEVQKIAFSTVSPAYWEIGLRISSNSNNGYSISSKSGFSSSFSGYSACRNASAAFGPAVQSALHKIVSHRNFSRLVE